MHGSPRSPYDNNEVWKKYDYRELGIIAEPYFDLDFSKVLYLTDTGRRWDGEGVSIRDKIPVRERGPEGSLCPRCLNLNYEDMDFAKGDLNQAYELAKKHLAQLREIADVQTICMHGSLPSEACSI